MAQPVIQFSLGPHLSARELSYGTEQCTWKWIHIDNMGGVPIEANEMVRGYRLKVDGKFHVQRLTEGTTYEVKFLVMLSCQFVMKGPVVLTLTLPNGIKKVRTEELMNKPRNKCIEIFVGDFIAQRSSSSCGCDCFIKFTMEKYSDDCMKGLVVIGALINPKI